MKKRSLEYIHKACWGLYAAGVDREIIRGILDWVSENALRPNGDFYFDEEEHNYKVLQRVYRPLTFLKVAAWIGHPLAQK